ncbi:autophagy-related protein 3 [Butyriboletus roseoflavus]|nr:autophagy-related protein 3 [Butyriboletus roseoflavus]
MPTADHIHISQVLKESKFKEHGRITPEEFVAAGDFLSYKFPVWTWECGDASKARDYLPTDKQYLVTRGVACLRRATSLAYTDADEDAERLLNFGDASGSAADEWVETHAGRKPTVDSAANPGEIDDIPDLDADGEQELATAIGNVSISSTTSATVSETPDLDDIPDMEEEGLEEGEDEATAAPKAVASGGVIDARQIEVAKGNLLQNRTPLTPSQIFQDVSADHALKTVTIEAFPHSATLQAASVHPCKHASVMKKVIERMNAGVVEEQLAARKKDGKDSKEGKKKWGFGRKSNKDDKSAGAGGVEDDEVEGMRVDFYLVVFLKFIASIVPTIEVDSTTAF